MFSQVTVGFGAVLIAVSGLAAGAGAVSLDTAIIPAILGCFFIGLGWLGRPPASRRPAAQQTARQRSPSLFSTIVAAALVFSSARGITLVSSALGSGAAPSATGVFLFLMALAGVGYIVVGAWTDIAQARRIARARAAGAARRPER